VPLALAQVGARPSSVGLPASLDSAVWSVVLLLSDKCGTCRSIAAALDGAVPRNVLIVIEPDVGDEAELILSYELDPDRTVIDPRRRISGKLGIRTTPSAIVVEHGRLVRATTVPSSRQLHALLEAPRAFQSRDEAESQPLERSKQ
jgi:hypothetical protein